MLLDNSIEFDTAFIVLPNGEYAETDVYVESSEWTALTGYTGQFGYNGAVFHPSEYFGGRLLKDVLEDVGGVYALTVVYDLEDDDQDAIGWTVLRKN